MRNHFKKLYALLVLFLLVSCTRIPATPSKPVQLETIRISALLGLSGDIASYGESQKKGIELADQEINSATYLGRGKRLEIAIDDSGSTAYTATTTMLRVILQDKPAGIIGPTLSSQAFVADPVAQRNTVPVIAISNTVQGITEMGDYIFRCSLPESSVIAGTIKLVAGQLRIKKVAILWGKDDDFTINGYKAFSDALKKNGLAIIADETFDRGNTDFKPQLSKIIALEPDAIVVSALVQEATLIAIQARALDFSGTIIGGNGFNSQEFIKQAGEAAEGVMCGTAWNAISTSPGNLKFISAFQKMHGAKPDQFAVQAYTGAWLYANAIRNAGSGQSKAIRDALANISNFPGPLGAFSFTVDREPVHPSAVQVVRKGKFVILNP